MGKTAYCSDFGFRRVFTGISVAVVEEFTFRGIILRALETRWHPRTALVLTSLLFGLLHALEQKLPVVETLQVLRQ